MLKAQNFILIFVFFIGCGVYPQKLTIENQMYEEKRFEIPCGNLNISAKGIRGDFLLELKFNVSDSTFLYGDSLKTKLNGKEIRHSFEIDDVLIGRENRGIYIEIPPNYWSRNKIDSLLIDFDGMIYCKNKKVEFENVYIIKEK